MPRTNAHQSTQRSIRARGLLTAALAGVLGLGLALQPATGTPADPAAGDRSDSRAVRYHTAKVDGLDIFYREAGTPGDPVVLLLHGFPTSSHMFRNLMPALADHYHVIAPDYPGFGNSSMPAADEFDYTFDNLATVTGHLIDQLGLDSYSIYVMDYGAPVGFRIATNHPERVDALIVQNGNAYEEGLREFWDPIKAYWNGGAATNRDALRGLLTIDATKWQYTHGVRDTAAISPDNWNIDQRLLDRPGNNAIQLDLFYDYRTNLPLYHVAAVPAHAPAAGADRVGRERSDLPRGGRASLQARRAGSRVPPARHGALRARRRRPGSGAADERVSCSRARPARLMPGTRRSIAAASVDSRPCGGVVIRTPASRQACGHSLDGPPRRPGVLTAHSPRS